MEIKVKIYSKSSKRVRSAANNRIIMAARSVKLQMAAETVAETVQPIVDLNVNFLSCFTAESLPSVNSINLTLAKTKSRFAHLISEMENRVAIPSNLSCLEANFHFGFVHVSLVEEFVDEEGRSVSQPWSFQFTNDFSINHSSSLLYLEAF